MTFGEQLNELLSILECTAKEVAAVSNITPATFSRYCNGLRTPAANSPEVDNLARGISALAKEKTSTHLAQVQDALEKLTDYQYVKEILLSTLEEEFDIEHMIEHFAMLVNALDMKLNKMAKSVGYDASYLSRIKAGQRKPADTKAFVSSVCQYVVANYESTEDKTVVARLIACEATALGKHEDYYAKLYQWLSSNSDTPKQHNSVNTFLENLDTFDLDEYIRSIHFDELKVPNMPINIIHPKTYYKLEGMKEGELDFFKGTVLSKAMDPILMYSDMPMEDMAQDLEFGKKWMFAIAMAIKKGLHLNMIHNLNRPFNELMLGLQSWIPLYMTGQISPYYLKGKPSSVFHQLIYVSGACALEGQCISSHHDHGKYTLYSSKADMAYYQTRARDLLSKASPLMEIYSDDDYELVENICREETKEQGAYKNILSLPPLYTISDALLEKILIRTGHQELIAKMKDEVRQQKEIIEKLLSHSELVENMSFLSREEFEKYPPCLMLPHQGEEICYTYEEYLEHIELTRKYRIDRPNYELNLKANAPFRNIQIRMKEDSWVIISKRKSPAIHFVIHHPQLISAIWNFIPLVEE